jgi:puromycin-sensitive aminopeptidase
MLKHQIKNIRLPNYIIPEKYQVQFKPDLDNFVFEGTETIFITVKKPTNKIQLHSRELDIKSVELTPALSLEKRGSSPKIKYDEKAERVVFTFPKKIAPGKYALKISFTGILNDSMRGFYRSKYEHEGKSKHMATTQFEATDARKAFPCFDEPAHKAIFEVSLIVPQHTTAISNTIETSIAEHSAGYKVINFAPSPRMSTYLLAFIIGEFEFLEGKTKHGVRIRVYTTPGKKHQAKFALDAAIKCLDFYDDYFAIPYPLPVLDLIAIPDFTSAAMENWGAITYRETALLVDEQMSSTANKQWVAIVVAHEIAHQWFGNLVTMHWWTDLWLNEGFASYMEHFAVDQLFPEWEIWKQFVSGRLNTALDLDSLQNTHPIEVEVRHPSEINEIFDQISYAKGASVIRMLAGYLGEKDFRDGLRHYLKKHSYQNTVTEDLWASFEKVSKKPIKKIMKSWTKRAGYPFITVVESGKNIALRQSRFYNSEISRLKAKIEQPWPIPLEITSNGKTVFKKLFSTKSAVLPKPKGPFKLNPGEESFIRVSYEPQFLEKLFPEIQNKKMPAPDRLAIIRDLFALSEAGLSKTSEALKTVANYKHEDELVVWEELATNLQNIRLLLFDQPYFEKYKNFAHAIFGPTAEKVGWQKQKGESHGQSLMRSLLLSQAGTFGHKKTIEQASKLFWDIQKGKNVLADVKGTVYNITAQNGGEKEHSALTVAYKKNSNQHEEQERVGRSLGSFKQPNLLKKTLTFSFSEAVRPQDSPGLFISVARNPFGRQIAWEFLKDNWKEIYKRYKGGHLLEWYIIAFEKFHTKEDLQDFKSFFTKSPHTGIERLVQQTTETINSNIAWLKRDAKEIGEWLNNLKIK